MKTLVLSDIHSNIHALEAIWAKESDSDMICCTGDLVDYGPFPCEILAWIRSRDVLCTVGNHDLWVVKNYRAGNFIENVREEDRTWAVHNASLLPEIDIFFLESLPEAVTFQLNGIWYGMTHMYEAYEEIVSLHAYFSFQKSRFRDLPGKEFRHLILGHTHRQAVRYLTDQILWLNPGSVSYRRPDDPDQTAHYATIIDGMISLKRLPYDFSPLRKYIQGITLKKSEMDAGERFFGVHGCIPPKKN